MKKSSKERLLQNELSELEEISLLKLAFEQRQKGHFTELLRKTESDKAARIVRFRQIGFGAVAAATCLFLLLPPTQTDALAGVVSEQLSKSHPRLGSDRYKIAIGNTMMGSKPSPQPTIPRSIKVDFDAGAFEKAATGLEQLTDKTHLSWYYLGYCHLWSKPSKGAEAIRCFQKSTEMAPQSEEEMDIQWFMALAHIQQKDWAAALDLLKKLPAHHYQHQDGSIQKLIDLLSKKN